ncbi:MAG: cytochrome c biogenesis protein CcdA [Spirochaetales bacterium]|nr:MAG: cytochrome c biogenesis protein CcdA [Spirochaetales bacterium]
MNQITVFVAFGAGLLSFLSPCVLPLIPGYLSFISGREASELRDGTRRAGVFFRTLFFVFGFSVVFVGLGLVFSGSGMLFAGRATRWITMAAGLIIVLFGLNMLFDFIKILNREARAHVISKPAGAIGAFTVGMAFGAGWTPCIGPILASILLVAARSGTTAEAVLLLAVYSFGLAVPFLLAGLFFERLSPLMAWFKQRGRQVRMASGILLVALGLAMSLGRLTALNAVFPRWGVALNAFLARDPTGATIAGVLFWVFVAAAIAAVPLIRKNRFATCWRIALLGVLSIIIAMEALGIVSIVKIAAGWLLFQGV